MATRQKTKSILTISPTSVAHAFASIQDELAALTDDELIQISVDIPYAHHIAVAAADRIDALLPELALLPFFDLERVRKIRVYAAAAQHAHLLAIAPEKANPQLPAMLEEASVLREDLLSTAELLARFGVFSWEVVEAIRAGSGPLDTTNDMQQLFAIYDPVWESVKHRVPITREMVDHAGELAYRLQRALGVKRIGELAPEDHPQRIRQQAYTLFVRSWDECRRGVLFLRSPFGDADVIAPSIYAKRRKRSSSSQVEPEETEAPTEAPQPALVTTTAPVVELEPTA